jgi:hypothetical protein
MMLVLGVVVVNLQPTFADASLARLNAERWTGFAAMRLGLGALPPNDRLTFAKKERIKTLLVTSSGWFEPRLLRKNRTGSIH